MKTLVCLLLLILSYSLTVSAQKIKVSEEGKRVICIINSESTKAGLAHAVDELAKYNVTLDIRESEFTKNGNLKKISFSVKNAVGEATYISDNMTKPKSAVQITSDLSPGAKNTIGVGSVTEKMD
ncbi:MAG: hypothetical protein K1X63_06700 [Chitinophagales bacterium]|nr:hypothetical protein [Chitinophagales bacterium]